MSSNFILHKIITQFKTALQKILHASSQSMPPQRGNYYSDLYQHVRFTCCTSSISWLECENPQRTGTESFLLLSGPRRCWAQSRALTICLPNEQARLGFASLLLCPSYPTRKVLPLSLVSLWQSFSLKDLVHVWSPFRKLAPKYLPPTTFTPHMLLPMFSG